MKISISRIPIAVLAVLLVGAAIFMFIMRETWEDPGVSSAPGEAREATSWPVYAGEGARKYIASTKINAGNVKKLKAVWTHHTGDVSTGRPEFGSTSAYEDTPILVEGILYTCSPFNRVSALDPATGATIWSHNPKIDLTINASNQFVCRGVSHWSDNEAEEGSVCSSRVFTATNDTRLIALDAKTGKLCEDFGTGGEINTSVGPGDAHYPGQYQHTSPPAIIGNSVVVGGAVGDHSGTLVPSGVVRAWDARDGHLVWAQDMAPPNYDYEVHGKSDAGYALASPNVWAPMTVDEELGLVYAPTGNPSPDYFRHNTPDIDYYGSSLLALDGQTGEIVWHYQFVHNDFWDYDTPAQPSFFDFPKGGVTIPALVQATKMGFIFILDRRTGEPLFEVEERPAPQKTDVELKLSPTQPWPVLPEPVAHTSLDPDESWGLSPWDRGECRKELESLNYDGMYTPPSTKWTLQFTGNAGGINWGGVAIDPVRNLLVVNSSNFAVKTRLIPRADFDRVEKENYGHEIGPQLGTPYGLWREIVTSPVGAPCNAAPWGVLTGIDLNTGEQLWQSTLGTLRDFAKEATGIHVPLKIGTPTVGGPLVTKSGLTFIGATLDNYIRAFDNATGKEIWKHRLPAPAVATPMSYVAKGADGKERQYIVIASGGYGKLPMDMSDSLVAFALED